MEPLEIGLTLLTAAIAAFLLLSCLWVWRDSKQRRMNQQHLDEMRKAQAESLISYTRHRKSQSRRNTGPISMERRHQRWAEKKERNLAPERGTKWTRLRKKKKGWPKKFNPADPISEDPQLEEEVVPEAVADTSPHPRSRPDITPDLIRRRSHVTEAEVAASPFRRPAQMPAIPEGDDLLVPEPVVSPLRRRMSEGELVTVPKRKWGGRQGSTEPATGQLGQQGRKRSRSRSPSDDSDRAQVVVEPKTGSAMFYA